MGSNIDNGECPARPALGPFVAYRPSLTAWGSRRANAHISGRSSASLQNRRTPCAAAAYSISPTAFFKHVYTRYYARSIGFSYWQGPRDREVDIVEELEGRLVPFEVKYRAPEHTGLRDLKGMLGFCAERGVDTGYVITREMTDFGVTHVDREGVNARLLNIPAPFACYWLGRSELSP